MDSNNYLLGPGVGVEDLEGFLTVKANGRELNGAPCKSSGCHDDLLENKNNTIQFTVNADFTGDDPGRRKWRTGERFGISIPLWVPPSDGCLAYQQLAADAGGIDLYDSDVDDVRPQDLIKSDTIIAQTDCDYYDYPSERAIGMKEVKIQIKEIPSTS